MRDQSFERNLISSFFNNFSKSFNDLKLEAVSSTSGFLKLINSRVFNNPHRNLNDYTKIFYLFIKNTIETTAHLPLPSYECINTPIKLTSAKSIKSQIL